MSFKSIENNPRNLLPSEIKDLLCHIGSTYLEQVTFPEADALVLWLWEATHVQKVVGSKPNSAYWMDIFTHACVVKMLMFV